MKKRLLLGNGNVGTVDFLPPIPNSDVTYSLKVVLTGGIPAFSWVTK